MSRADVKHTIYRITFLFSLLWMIIAFVYGTINAETPLLYPDVAASIKKACLTLLTFILLFVGLSVVIVIVRKLSGLHYFAVVALLSLLFIVASGNASAPLVVLFFVFSAMLLGRNLLRLIKIREIDTAIPMVSFLIGAGVYGTITGLLAHFPVNTPFTYLVLLCMPLIFFHADARQLYLSIKEKCKESVHHSNKAILAISALSLFYLIIPIYPEIGFDALAVHLFISTHVLENLSWGYNPEFYSWGLMPLFGNWIYTICFALGGEVAARLINIVFMGIVALCTRAISKDIINNNTVANFAVILFLLTPLTMIESASLFVENIWASYLAASTILVVRFLTSRSTFSDTVIIGGYILGISAATKAITLPIFAVFSLFVLLRIDRVYKEWSSKAFFQGISLLLLFGTIPYATAWVISGNPVFPFFNSIFQSPFYPLSDFTNPLFTSGLSWTLPYDVLFSTTSYLEANNGASGFQWLLLLPTAFIILTYHRNWVGLAYFSIGIAIIFVVFQNQSYLRYIYPACAILSALSTIGIMSLHETGKMLSNAYRTIFAITLAGNAIFMMLTAFPYWGFQITALFSQQQRADFIEQHVPIQRAVDIVNSINSIQSPVAILGNHMVARLKADALHANWYNSKFAVATRNQDTASSFHDLLKQYQAEYIIMDDNWWDGKRRQVVREASREIAKVSTLSIRQLHLSYDTELVINPDFSSLDAWTVSKGIIYDKKQKTVAVNQSSSLFQKIDINPYQKLENTVVANCVGQPTTGRLQVNWHDAKNTFIKTDIHLFECQDAPKEYKMTIVAPRKADYAMLYTTGHTNEFLQYRLNSLKK